MTGIYKITSPSGKIYIGQSWDIQRRWKFHKRGKEKTYLQNSFNKYGYENHKFEIIYEMPFDVIQEDLNDAEIVFIKLYKECGISLLNMNDGGTGGKGYRHTDESKMQMSLLAKQRGVPIELIKKMHESNKGRNVTDEVKKRISEKLKGIKHSEDRRLNIMKSLQGKWKANKGSFQIGHKAKLTKEQANEIRGKYIPREYSIRKLASEYNADTKTIRGILNKTIKCYL